MVRKLAIAIAALLCATQVSAMPDSESRTAKKLIIASSWGKGYGGYIEYNTAVDELCKRKAENPDSLIMIDQEGGAVVRYHDPPSVPVAPKKLVSVTPEQYFAHSVSVAQHLKKDHCIDVNLSTVLEPIWGPGVIRSIPTTMDDVFKYGRVFSDAMHEGGVIPTLKHFPGSTRNVKFLLGKYRPRPGEPLEVKEEHPGQLKEYAMRFAPKPTDAVMVSHSVYPEYSPRPAVIEPLYYRWLREDLRFDGLIITDAINEVQLSDDELFQAFLLADMVLISDGRVSVRVEKLLANWIHSGRIPKAVLDKKLERINRYVEFARSQK